MRKKTAYDLCIRCIDQILDNGRSAYIENLAVQFTRDAKEGKYDGMSDKEYDTLLAETEELAKLWDDRPRKTAGNILLGILANARETDRARRAGLADLLAGLLSGPAGSERLPGRQTAEDFEPEFTEEILDDLDLRFDDISIDGAVAAAIEESLRIRPPREIRDGIARHVIGQPEAAKAAALITYNHLAGRRTNAVFCGPSGCGKSEIWRCLSREYPGLVRMVDFSRFSAEGWNGSLHLRDIFDGISPGVIRERGLIVVLDEADKILCEHAVGGSGTDHNVLLQNDLLKMMDGDVIEFGEDNKKPALSVDCSKVSVVMLGAFERLLQGKSRDARPIGFGSGAAGADAGNHKDISYDDLIKAGMRREIAGRVNSIVALDPLSLDSYKAILEGPVLSGIRESLGREVRIDAAGVETLAARAMESGLGVRWMRSAICNAVDEILFDDPCADRGIDLSGRAF